MDSTKLKNHVVAVASDIPRARIYSGYASAEYVLSNVLARRGRSIGTLSVQGYGPLSRRIHHSKQVDAECDASNPSRMHSRLWYEEAETREE